mmetsp:Transcript_15887/g.22634  ORF Transcript_15887/g.22634 Transcript_15887/m.22634 type:complete len:102 (+) Transcript_15887:531-836(+)
MSHIFLHLVKLHIKSSGRNDMVVDIHQIDVKFYFSGGKEFSEIANTKCKRSFPLERDYRREVKVVFVNRRQTIIYELIMKTKIKSLEEILWCLLELYLFNV